MLIRCRLECCVNLERPFKKSWRFPVREMIKGQSSYYQFLIHAVKGGQTSSSISKHNQVFVHSIAPGDENISDAADLVSKDQLLNIPASASADTKAVTVAKDGLLSVDEQQRTQVHQKPYMVLIKHHRFPLAKSSGYFIVLLLLVAFCLRRVTGALRARVPKELERQVSDEPKSRMRWRNVFRDTEEKYDLESTPDLKSTSSDQDQHSSEDVPHEYDKLKHDYQKFLSECGITESGYWRRGSTQ